MTDKFHVHKLDLNNEFAKSEYALLLLLLLIIITTNIIRDVILLYIFLSIRCSFPIDICCSYRIKELTNQPTS
jgi:hypothetical protein